MFFPEEQIRVHLYGSATCANRSLACKIDGRWAVRHPEDAVFTERYSDRETAAQLTLTSGLH
jgi:hypothetical protein